MRGENYPDSESRLNFDLRDPQLCALAKPAAKPRTDLKLWFTEEDQEVASAPCWWDSALQHEVTAGRCCHLVAEFIKASAAAGSY